MAELRPLGRNPALQPGTDELEAGLLATHPKGAPIYNFVDLYIYKYEYIFIYIYKYIIIHVLYTYYVYIYIRRERLMPNILHPIWKHTQKESRPPRPPHAGPPADGAWMGWALGSG